MNLDEGPISIGQINRVLIDWPVKTGPAKNHIIFGRALAQPGFLTISH
jgi:hypothetical protein